MATVWAVNSGNVSVGANWNTGVVPGIGDDVYADGKNMVVDLPNWSIRTLCTTQRAGGTASGSFTISASSYIATIAGYHTKTALGGILITANSPNTVNLIGDFSNYSAGNCSYGFYITGSATINIIGNQLVNTGAYMGFGIYYLSTGGAVNHLGNLIGTGGAWAIGGTNGVGLRHSGTGVYTQTGTLIAGSTEAVQVLGTGVFIGLGVATSSSTMPAIYSNGSNNVFYDGILQMQTPPTAQIPVIYQGTTGTGCVYFKGIAENKSTTNCIYALRMVLMSTGSTQWTFKDELGVDKTLYSTDSGMFGYPAEGDTRDGVIYGQANEFLGSLKVAPPASVVENVPTDHTVGSYKLTQSNIEAYVTNAVAAIKAKTDLIPDHPASIESTGGQIGGI